MVMVRFKLSEAEPVELSLDGPQKLQGVLAECAARAKIDLGGYIAVRNGRVVTGDAVVEDADEIDVFPAISGG